jgi:pSer/pThr/pTyr-binding forkhead associated (FHA) protein
VHCEITHGPGVGFQVRDLRAMNGTFVNGRRLPTGGACELRAGDTLGLGAEAVGGVTFRVRDLLNF